MYDCLVDVWSIGCIFAELITGRVLFPGSDPIDQWTKIIEIVGTPNSEFCKRLEPQAKNYVEYLPHYYPRPWKTVFPSHIFPPVVDSRLTGKKNFFHYKTVNALLAFKLQWQGI